MHCAHAIISVPPRFNRPCVERTVHVTLCCCPTEATGEQRIASVSPEEQIWPFTASERLKLSVKRSPHALACRAQPLTKEAIGCSALPTGKVLPRWRLLGWAGSRAEEVAVVRVKAPLPTSNVCIKIVRVAQPWKNLARVGLRRDGQREATLCCLVCDQLRCADPCALPVSHEDARLKATPELCEDPITLLAPSIGNERCARARCVTNHLSRCWRRCRP